jgi:hypothetical protein
VSTLPDILREARRLVALAAERDVRARLIGGLAVLDHAHAPMPDTYAREYGDIDLVIRRGEHRRCEELMAASGYTPIARFNALRGADRLMFEDERHSRRVDVFVGRFEMCHSIDLSDRLPEDGTTLTLADMLLTKLQIFELNLKDVYDALVVLRDHELAEGGGSELIDSGHVRDVCSADWGWYTTVTDNLAKLDAASDEILSADSPRARARIAELLDVLESSKKSRRWKMRSAVGRRTPWYALPEEI